MHHLKIRPQSGGDYPIHSLSGNYSASSLGVRRVADLYRAILRAVRVVGMRYWCSASLVTSRPVFRQPLSVMPVRPASSRTSLLVLNPPARSPTTVYVHGGQSHLFDPQLFQVLPAISGNE